jgi:hypothetical protein
MADYDPLIPQANDLISQSQSDILNNFGELNTIFNNDHYTWDYSTSAYRGLHRKITFPLALGSDPALAGMAGYLFLKNDPNDASARAQVYYKNITETLQVTNRFHSAVTNGYIQLQGGIIFMWGKISNPGSGNHTENFNTIANYTGAPVGFPNACFNVSLTVNGTSSTQTAVLNQSTPFTSTSFSYRMSASGPDVFWYAIGN